MQAESTWISSLRVLGWISGRLVARGAGWRSRHPDHPEIERDEPSRMFRCESTTTSVPDAGAYDARLRRVVESSSTPARSVVCDLGAGCAPDARVPNCGWPEPG